MINKLKFSTLDRHYLVFIIKTDRLTICVPNTNCNTYLFILFPIQTIRYFDIVLLVLFHINNEF